MSIERRSHRDEPDRSDDDTRDTATGPDDAAAGGTPEPADSAAAAQADPGHPGSPRRRSRLAIGSVAAAVLLAGGGGAYFATTATGGRADTGTHASQAGGTPPPLALDGYPADDATATTPGASGGSGPAGIAPGEPDPRGPNGTVYRAEQALPKGPAEAQVYRATGTVTSAQVTRLAKALGVTGTPRLSGENWLVGAGAGNGADAGPALQVGRQAPGVWTFSRTAPGKETQQKAVSESAAKAAAAPVLKALGEDDAKLDATTLLGGVRLVNADPEIGGLPTYGWSTGIRVGSDGTVTGGNGRILTPVTGDTYPVLGADKTLDLLNKTHQGRMTPFHCPAGVAQGKQDGSTGQETVCGQPPGSAPATSSVVPVRGARFGLATHSVAGRPALVPSWLFEVRPRGADGSLTLTYPAVDPAYLASGSTGSDSGTGASPGPSDTAKVRLTSYTASGRSLTVHFYGGVCSTYTTAAAETNSKVTVTVTQHKAPPGKICIMIAKEMTRTVTLKQPVDGRTVVDGTGATVRKG